jgi:hypothetical protein
VIDQCRLATGQPCHDDSRIESEVEFCN